MLTHISPLKNVTPPAICKLQLLVSIKLQSVVQPLVLPLDRTILWCTYIITPLDGGVTHCCTHVQILMIPTEFWILIHKTILHRCRRGSKLLSFPCESTLSYKYSQIHCGNLPSGSCRFWGSELQYKHQKRPALYEEEPVNSATLYLHNLNVVVIITNSARTLRTARIRKEE